ncbi:MAG: GHMP kinase [Thermoplasmata archaeon]|nr:MAG: GHMP kinase [Thermoplasmata archaeon]
MLVRSKAPLRISFGGGGTDIPPYTHERGGVVLNTTINKYAYCTLKPTDVKEISVTSLDYDIVAKYHSDKDLVYNGELDLVKAAIKRLRSTKTEQNDRSLDNLQLFLHSDAPPGSGLGSSSTMAVALVGAMAQWLKLPLTHYDIADLAYKIERQDLEIEGGYQDQYASSFGGFNFIEFKGDTIIVNQLKIRRSTLNEFEYNLLLCYTGGTRLSANIIKDQVCGFVKRKSAVVEALDETKSLAIAMKEALLRGELTEFGELLHKAWLQKKNFSEKITSPAINKMYEEARKAGALGGKLLGAGGGGYFIFYCDFEKVNKVAETLEKLNGEIVDFSFENRGLQSWESRNIS